MSMIQEKLFPFFQALEQKKAVLTAQIAKLEQEGRRDEANLGKVRLNIVNVFETVANADQKSVEAGGWKDFCSRYEPRFDKLSEPWRARLEKARAHGDADTIAVEEAKLEMLAWIRSTWLAMKGDKDV